MLALLDEPVKFEVAFDTTAEGGRWGGVLAIAATPTGGSEVASDVPFKSRLIAWSFTPSGVIALGTSPEISIETEIVLFEVVSLFSGTTGPAPKERHSSYFLLQSISAGIMPSRV